MGLSSLQPDYSPWGMSEGDWQAQLAKKQREREMADVANMADTLMGGSPSMGSANPLSNLVGETGIRGLSYISTMNPDQQSIFKMLMERMTQGGYTGDRVADMTPDQQSILGGVGGMIENVNTPQTTTPDFQKLLGSRGFVGKQGPEVIEAKKDVRILPNENPWSKTTRRMATGGVLKKGQRAVVGERGPELFTPSNSGVITPNNKLSGSGAISGGMTFVFAPQNFFGDEAGVRRVLMPVVNEAMRKYVRENGVRAWH